MHKNKSLLFTIPLLLLLFITQTAVAQQDTLKVSDWLILGPVETQLPVYHDQKNIQNKTFTLTDLLNFEPVDISGWYPEEGKTFEWSQSLELEWKSESGEIIEIESENEKPQHSWTAFYLTSDRFTEATLEIKSHHPFKLYINGSEKASKTGSENENADASSHSEKLALTQDKHLVIIRSLYAPENNADLTLSATVSWDSDASITQSLTPMRVLDLETLSNQPSVNNLALSADGSLAAMRIHNPHHPMVMVNRGLRSGRLKEESFSGNTKEQKILADCNGRRKD